MSRASEKSKDGTEGKVQSVGSISEGEEEEDIDVEDAAREETPDLYRHSALGMCVSDCIFVCGLSYTISSALGLGVYVRQLQSVTKTDYF